MPAELPPPGEPGAGTDRAGHLAAYFAEHRNRYTPEALRRAATQAGYSDAEISAAWPPVGWVFPAEGTRIRTRLGVVIATTFLYGIGVYLLVVESFALTASSSVTVVAYLVAGGVGIAAWRLLGDSRPSLARGFGCGVIVAFVIPVVLFIAALGVCVATGGNPQILNGG